MRVLGISGSLVAEYERGFPKGIAHDAAAVLVEDGEVVAAIEEERLSRAKHTNRGPFRAMRFCLEQAGTSLAALDALAVYMSEEAAAELVADESSFPWLPRGRLGPSVRPHDLVLAALAPHFDEAIDPGRIRFVDHHLCHAWSAAAYCGDAPGSTLVVTLDGSDGTGCCGLVGRFDGARLEELRRLRWPKNYLDEPTQSVGDFYTQLIAYLGYELFDEYKVMGLAPYGDPARYRGFIRSMISLEPGGGFTIDLTKRDGLRGDFPVRRRGEPFLQEHKDFAASLQEGLELLVEHQVGHFARETSLRNLALAGGVAHNCTANGKLLRSGLFDRVFVQPAAHDAGCALGAALYVHDRLAGATPKRRLATVYWGSDVGGTEERALSRWRDLVRYERAADVVDKTADALAGGKVVGWVQGRSEFGPRALGNRSILADPRPADNRSRINAMVKKREGYRPFAPSVLADDVHAYFDVPPNSGDAMSFMTFVVPVRPEHRVALGAITHVDGTARVQAVSRAQNGRYHALISAFKERTGVGMLLNTSFNNNAEPIVDSADDAIVSFLTTRLDALILGDFWVERAPGWRDAVATLRLALPRHYRLSAVRRFDGAAWVDDHRIERLSDDESFQGGPLVYAVLVAADSGRPLSEHLAGVPAEGRQAVLDEVVDLWERRLVTLTPAVPA